MHFQYGNTLKISIQKHETCPKIKSLFSQQSMLLRIKQIGLIVFALCLNPAFQACKSGHQASMHKSSGNDTLENYPYWIAMMDSTGVNYYAAVAAFDSYWKHREKPTEDNGEGKDIYGKEKTGSEKKKEDNRSLQYVYEYKQFLNWQQRNKNLVKPDGTIMTPEEVLEQWKKSQNDTLTR